MVVDTRQQTIDLHALARNVYLLSMWPFDCKVIGSFSSPTVQALSVLFGTSASNINKIQRVHNTLAKIVLNDLALPSVSALRQLHWLPINRRINFKIAILIYRALQSGTPSYLSSLINLNTTSRALRSSSLSLLHVPFTTTAIGRRAFRFATSTIWNSIPLSIRSLPSLNSFKRSVKSHLFSLDSTWSRPCYTSASDSSFAWICVLYKFHIMCWWAEKNT